MCTENRNIVTYYIIQYTVLLLDYICDRRLIECWWQTKILILRRLNTSLTTSTPSSRKENFKILNY